MRITFTRASEDRQLREWEYHQDMMMDEDDRPEWVCEPDDDCTKAKCARCKRGRR